MLNEVLNLAVMDRVNTDEEDEVKKKGDKKKVCYLSLVVICL